MYSGLPNQGGRRFDPPGSLSTAAYFLVPRPQHEGDVYRCPPQNTIVLGLHSSRVQTKKPVTKRLDSDVIAWLKADGRGYQTKANGLLRHAMLHYTREKGLSKPEGFRRKTAQQKGKA
jgi:hypothetical protein